MHTFLIIKIESCTSSLLNANRKFNKKNDEGLIHYLDRKEGAIKIKLDGGTYT